ncbi:hypothetical protein BVC80_9101g108 [Macleaya cordata]|uniref:Uncharacterized protein n=1 Tax=Macleaya cordata TaxID=56857 RepID=A0A200QGG6_MACCD|nr:hypothetical protein BVC80_9101g108 [Macleaya cordata]
MAMVSHATVAWHPCCLSKQPSLDDQQYLPNKPTYGSKPPRHNHFQKENLLRKSFAGLDSVRIEEEDEDEDFNEDDSSVSLSGFFNGLLTIGTLGSDPPVVSEPETPTFAVSVENVTEKETELTENDLKLINEELEKVLGADVKDDRYYNDSSGRTSHVSGRTSHGSSITLSGSTDHQVINGANGTAVCPLQGYLFGSPIDLPETTTVATRKEHRTSLGELFQKSKIEEKSGENKEDKRDSTGEKSMKKMLKWRLLRGSTATADSVSAENKLQKLLQIFNRKVHPESSTAIKRSNKSHKNESNKNNNNNVPYYDGDYCNNADDRTALDEDIMLFPPRTQTQRERTLTKDRLRRYKSHSNPPPFELGGSDSNGNREYWIKTDADCKYYYTTPSLS